jgi:hypothetical protein
VWDIISFWLTLALRTARSDVLKQQHPWLSGTAINIKVCGMNDDEEEEWHCRCLATMMP